MSPSDILPCQETSGFLFAHVCGRPSVFSCQRCGKRICAQHARPSPPEAFLCITCARAGGVDDTDSDRDDDDDDPYFYASDYRQRSWTSDPMDFQEGDRAALDDEAAGGGWETVEGGS
jgi:hypothetical protein